MYGFQKKTDFAFLIGKEICQVGIGSYDVQFNWGTGGISATNEFRFTPSGTTEEMHWRGASEDIEIAARTVRLLKTTIVAASCTPDVLTLTFSNGDSLDLIDSTQCESVVISDGKDPMIVI